jgi:recombination protein RecA
MAVRATVEALLRERKLDRTLTSAIPERLGEDAVAPLDVDALDRGLAGGLPRGHVSEVVGPASSGRTGLVWAALAAATRRGETVALVDTFDRFDPPTAAACGIVLPRLLWVRGQAVSKTAVAIDPAWLPGVRAVNGPGTFVERVIDRALKSLNLVVQSRVCTLVVIDLIDVPAQALRRLPAATWFRIERAIEGSDTAVVILAAQPVARSSGGRSIVMGADSRVSTSACAKATADKPDCRLPTPDSRLPSPVWRGTHDRTRRLGGVRTTAAIGAARWSGSERVGVETRFVHAV